MLDIEFEDTREIIQINDLKAAETIKAKIEGLHTEMIKEQEEVSTANQLLYRTTSTHGLNEPMRNTIGTNARTTGNTNAYSRKAQ